MTESIRHQLLTEATQQFAEYGFYGASLANIALSVGVTKQTLLHHFGSKQKLYAEVLTSITQAMEQALDAALAHENDPVKRFESAIMVQFEIDTPQGYSYQILVRELLDVHRRIADVDHWVLKTWLNRLVQLRQEAQPLKQVSKTQALAEVYTLLGSINYFGISHTVLDQLYGTPVRRDLARALPKILKSQLQTLLVQP